MKGASFFFPCKNKAAHMLDMIGCPFPLELYPYFHSIHILSHIKSPCSWELNKNPQLSSPPAYAVTAIIIRRDLCCNSHAEQLKHILHFTALMSKKTLWNWHKCCTSFLFHHKQLMLRPVNKSNHSKNWPFFFLLS